MVDDSDNIPQSVGTLGNDNDEGLASKRTLRRGIARQGINGSFMLEQQGRRQSLLASTQTILTMSLGVHALHPRRLSQQARLSLPHSQSSHIHQSADT
jgi:hypothetical protein